MAVESAPITGIATIAVMIALSLLSGLLALFIVLPVLGHATWHLYRRAVEAPR